MNSNLQNHPYDKSVLYFSKEGELLQVQYARKAGLQGETALCGISAEDEIVVCIPRTKKLQILMDQKVYDKIMRIDKEKFLVFAGLGGDGRSIVEFARNFCVKIASQLNFPPALVSVSNHISQLQHEASLMGNRRPFGVQTLLLGYSPEKKKMEIYFNEPSGKLF